MWPAHSASSQLAFTFPASGWCNIKKWLTRPSVHCFPKRGRTTSPYPRPKLKSQTECLSVFLLVSHSPCLWTQWHSLSVEENLVKYTWSQNRGLWSSAARAGSGPRETDPESKLLYKTYTFGIPVPPSSRGFKASGIYSGLMNPHNALWEAGGEFIQHRWGQSTTLFDRPLEAEFTQIQVLP